MVYLKWLIVAVAVTVLPQQSLRYYPQNQVVVLDTLVCGHCQGTGRAGKCGLCNGRGMGKAMCMTCFGRGYYSKRGKCRTCKGRGWIWEKCPACKGTGKSKCWSCDGRGYHLRKELNKSGSEDVVR